MLVRHKYVLEVVIISAMLLTASLTYIHLRRRGHMKPSVAITRLSSEEVPLYSLLEIDLNVTAQYENPFDPDDIDVVAVFTSPSGKKIVVPAFYYQDFKREISGDREVLVPVGSPYWKVRFTPTEVGEYSFYVRVRDRFGNTAQSETHTFNAVPSNLPGFVRLSSKDPRYLTFDNGRSAFFIGHDVCWSGKPGTFAYDIWFSKMQESGENITRIWMAPWCFGIEWKKLGYYDLAEAWKLDYVIKLAEKKGIYILLCLMNHGQLRREDEWKDNPYNKARGGPLSKPEDFWTNDKAIELFKKRLRYIVARWGYSTHILAWELWNEVDLTDGYSSLRDEVARWHKIMGDYLKEIDPYKHLVTTSFANPSLDSKIWKLKEMDIVTVHRYGPSGFKDIAKGVQYLIKTKWQEFKKPVIITEFGADWRWWGHPYYYDDKDGVEIHNGIWSAIMAGSPSTAMLWWWDVYIHKYDLYYHYKALAKYLSGIHPDECNFKDLKAEIVLPKEVKKEYLTSITLYPALDWARPKENYFTVSLNGTISGDISQLSFYIQGKAHPDLKNNPIFKVTFPYGGRVVIHVNSVAQGGAVLTVYLDNFIIKQMALPDIDGKNDGNANEYNIDVAIDVPPGTHEIKVDNTGNDWFTWDYIRFEGAVLKQGRARILGLNNGTFALVWIQNSDHTWWNVISNIRIEPIKDLEIKLYGFEDGKYIVEFWDTYKGEIVKKETVTASGGIITLTIDNLETDIALKIYRT